MSAESNGTAPARRIPKAIFFVCGVIVETLGVVAAIRGLGAGMLVLAAVACAVIALGLVKGATSADWSAVLNVALSAACGVLLAAALSGSVPSKAAASHVEAVRLLAPRRGFTFSGTHFDKVRGTVRGLRQGETLWLMVQTIGDDNAYVMSKPCLVEDDGEFRCPPVYAGLPRPTRAHLLVMVRILDSTEIRQVIGDWTTRLQAGKESLFYGGPVGRPGASVVVYRAA